MTVAIDRTITFLLVPRLFYSCHLVCFQILGDSLANMAVTDTFPAMIAEILVNGVALQEYDDDEDNTVPSTKAVKYIEAVSGAEFAIRYRIDERPQYDVRLDFCLDGKSATNKILQLDRFCGGSIENVLAGVSSNKDGEWVQSNFTFSDLNIRKYVTRQLSF